MMTAPFDVTGVRLETDRLILRPWEEKDLPDFFAYTGDAAVAPGMGWTCVESMDMARKFLAVYISKKESLALELKETGEVIGDISVQPRPWERYPIDPGLQGREFGFGVNSRFWGRGLMPEAVAAVKDHCFRTLGYDFLTCGHFFGNEKSKRVIEKCGFTHLFDAAHTLPNGKTFDISTYIQYNPHKER